MATGSAAACVHFQVRVSFEQILHRHERPAIAKRETPLRAAIVARTPDVGYPGPNCLDRVPSTQRFSQINTVRRIEAEVPHAIRCQTAAVAGAAERSGRGRDDAEHGPVWEREAISGGRRGL